MGVMSNQIFIKSSIRRAVLRAASAALAAAILCQDAAFAASDLLRTASAVSARPAMDWAKSTLPGIPESVARIEDAHRGEGGIVLLVQDAHTNASAQLNQAKLLDHVIALRESAAPVPIMTEGGQGDLGLSGLRPLLPLAERRIIASKYLQRGLLHAAEYLDLTSDRRFVLRGVEDPELYRASIEIYRKMAAGREAMLAHVSKMRSLLEMLKPRLLSPQLLEWDRALNASGDDSKRLIVILEGARSAGLGAGRAAYPNAALYLRLRKDEAAIDSAAVEREHAELLSVLPETERAQLLSAASSKDPAVRRTRTALLTEHLARAGSKYAHLRNYVAHERRILSLDPEELLRESERLERRVVRALDPAGAAEAVFDSARRIDDIADAFALKLTPDAFDRLSRQADPIRTVTGYLNRQILRLDAGHEKAVFLDPAAAELLAAAMRFYQLAGIRDEAFVSRIEAEPSPFMILVAGGFHAPNLKRLLKKKNISYISVVPQVLHETDIVRYESILLSQLRPLAPQPPAASAAPADRLNTAYVRSDLRPAATDGFWHEVGSTPAALGARMATAGEGDAVPEGPAEALDGPGLDEMLKAIDVPDSDLPVLRRILDKFGFTSRKFFVPSEMYLLLATLTSIAEKVGLQDLVRTLRKEGYVSESRHMPEKNKRREFHVVMESDPTWTDDSYFPAEYKAWLAGTRETPPEYAISLKGKALNRPAYYISDGKKRYPIKFWRFKQKTIHIVPYFVDAAKGRGRGSRGVKICVVKDKSLQVDWDGDIATSVPFREIERRAKLPLITLYLVLNGKVRDKAVEAFGPLVDFRGELDLHGSLLEQAELAQRAASDEEEGYTGQGQPIPYKRGEVFRLAGTVLTILLAENPKEIFYRPRLATDPLVTNKSGNYVKPPLVVRTPAGLDVKVFRSGDDIGEDFSQTLIEYYSAKEVSENQRNAGHPIDFIVLHPDHPLTPPAGYRHGDDYRITPVDTLLNTMVRRSAELLKNQPFGPDVLKSQDLAMVQSIVINLRAGTDALSGEALDEYAQYLEGFLVRLGVLQSVDQASRPEDRRTRKPISYETRPEHLQTFGTILTEGILLSLAQNDAITLSEMLASCKKKLDEYHLRQRYTSDQLFVLRDLLIKVRDHSKGWLRRMREMRQDPEAEIQLDEEGLRDRRQNAEEWNRLLQELITRLDVEWISRRVRPTADTQPVIIPLAAGSAAPIFELETPAGGAAAEVPAPVQAETAPAPAAAPTPPTAEQVEASARKRRPIEPLEPIPASETDPQREERHRRIRGHVDRVAAQLEGGAGILGVIVDVIGIARSLNPRRYHRDKSPVNEASQRLRSVAGSSLYASLIDSLFRAAPDEQAAAAEAQSLAQAIEENTGGGTVAGGDLEGFLGPNAARLASAEMMVKAVHVEKWALEAGKGLGPVIAEGQYLHRTTFAERVVGFLEEIFEGRSDARRQAGQLGPVLEVLLGYSIANQRGDEANVQLVHGLYRMLSQGQPDALTGPEFAAKFADWFLYRSDRRLKFMTAAELIPVGIQSQDPVERLVEAIFVELPKRILAAAETGSSVSVEVRVTPEELEAFQGLRQMFQLETGIEVLADSGEGAVLGLKDAGSVDMYRAAIAKWTGRAPDPKVLLAGDAELQAIREIEALEAARKRAELVAAKRQEVAEDVETRVRPLRQELADVLDHLVAAQQAMGQLVKYPALEAIRRRLNGLTALEHTGEPSDHESQKQWADVAQNAERAMTTELEKIALQISSMKAEGPSVALMALGMHVRRVTDPRMMARLPLNQDVKVDVTEMAEEPVSAFDIFQKEYMRDLAENGAPAEGDSLKNRMGLMVFLIRKSLKDENFVIQPELTELFFKKYREAGHFAEAGHAPTLHELLFWSLAVSRGLTHPLIRQGKSGPYYHPATLVFLNLHAAFVRNSGQSLSGDPYGKFIEKVHADVIGQIGEALAGINPNASTPDSESRWKKYASQYAEQKIAGLSLPPDWILFRSLQGDPAAYENALATGCHIHRSAVAAYTRDHAADGKTVNKLQAWKDAGLENYDALHKRGPEYAYWGAGREYYDRMIKGRHLMSEIGEELPSEELSALLDPSLGFYANGIWFHHPAWQGFAAERLDHEVGPLTLEEFADLMSRVHRSDAAAEPDQKALDDFNRFLVGGYKSSIYFGLDQDWIKNNFRTFSIQLFQHMIRIAAAGMISGNPRRKVFELPPPDQPKNLQGQPELYTVARESIVEWLASGGGGQSLPIEVRTNPELVWSEARRLYEDTLFRLYAHLGTDLNMAKQPLKERYRLLALAAANGAEGLPRFRRTVEGYGYERFADEKALAEIDQILCMGILVGISAIPHEQDAVTSIVWEKSLRTSEMLSAARARTADFLRRVAPELDADATAQAIVQSAASTSESSPEQPSSEASGLAEIVVLTPQTESERSVVRQVWNNLGRMRVDGIDKKFMRQIVDELLAYKPGGRKKPPLGSANDPALKTIPSLHHELIQAINGDAMTVDQVRRLVAMLRLVGDKEIAGILSDGLELPGRPIDLGHPDLKKVRIVGLYDASMDVVMERKNNEFVWNMPDFAGGAAVLRIDASPQTIRRALDSDSLRILVASVGGKKLLSIRPEDLRMLVSPQKAAHPLQFRITDEMIRLFESGSRSEFPQQLSGRGSEVARRMLEAVPGSELKPISWWSTRLALIATGFDPQEVQDAQVQAIYGVMKSEGLVGGMTVPLDQGVCYWILHHIQREHQRQLAATEYTIEKDREARTWMPAEWGAYLGNGVLMLNDEVAAILDKETRGRVQRVPNDTFARHFPGSVDAEKLAKWNRVAGYLENFETARGMRPVVFTPAMFRRNDKEKISLRLFFWMSWISLVDTIGLREGRYDGRYVMDAEAARAIVLSSVSRSEPHFGALVAALFPDRAGPPAVSTGDRHREFIEAQRVDFNSVAQTFRTVFNRWGALEPDMHAAMGRAIDFDIRQHAVVIPRILEAFNGAWPMTEIMRTGHPSSSPQSAPADRFEIGYAGLASNPYFNVPRPGDIPATDAASQASFQPAAGHETPADRVVQTLMEINRHWFVRSMGDLSRKSEHPRVLAELLTQAQSSRDPLLQNVNSASGMIQKALAQNRTLESGEEWFGYLLPQVRGHADPQGRLPVDVVNALIDKVRDEQYLIQAAQRNADLVKKGALADYVLPDEAKDNSGESSYQQASGVNETIALSLSKSIAGEAVAAGIPQSQLYPGYNRLPLLGRERNVNMAGELRKVNGFRDPQRGPFAGLPGTIRKLAAHYENRPMPKFLFEDFARRFEELDRMLDASENDNRFRVEFFILMDQLSVAVALTRQGQPFEAPASLSGPVMGAAALILRPILGPHITENWIRGYFTRPDVPAGARLAEARAARGDLARFVLKVYDAQRRTGQIAVGGELLDINVSADGRHLMVDGITQRPIKLRIQKLSTPRKRAPGSVEVLKSELLMQVQAVFNAQTSAVRNHLKQAPAAAASPAVLEIYLDGLATREFEGPFTNLLVHELKALSDSSTRIILKGKAKRVGHVLRRARKLYRSQEFVVGSEHHLPAEFRDPGVGRTAVVAGKADLAKLRPGQKRLILRRMTSGALPNLRAALATAAFEARTNLGEFDARFDALRRAYEVLLDRPIADASEFASVLAGLEQDPGKAWSYSIALHPVNVSILLQTYELLSRQVRQSA